MDAQMTHQVQTEVHQGYATVVLNRPRANAIGRTMVRELLETLTELERNDSVRCLLLTGAPGMFSAGLDVPELIHFDRPTMTEFWREFNELCYRLYTSDLMIVTAVSGHSPAGGCVLAILTDYRIMAEGRYKIGLNEVAVGIPIPGGLTDIYASLLGLAAAQDLGCRGAMLNPQQALELGLVQEVVPSDELLSRARAKIEQWLACNQDAQVTTKHLFRRQLAQMLEATADRDQKSFLDLWFSDQAQSILQALVARLS
jgi:enoyl-CoA hydratase/carnithine racemase